MRKRKSLFWFLLWTIALSVCSLFSAAQQVYEAFNPSFLIEWNMPFVLICISLILLPILCISLYYAIKEGSKFLKIATVCLITHHLLCIVAAIIGLFHK